MSSLRNPETVVGETSRITIGTVPYLNGKPLVRWFADTDEGRASGIRVVDAVPFALARMLEAGEIAAALVSSVELFRRPGYTYAPNVAIAADGPVESVRLLSRVPIEEIRSVALDSSSLTSVALLKILLTELYGIAPDYRTLPPNLETMLASTDAALLIGDLGYRDYGPEFHILDLGAGWKRLTGLPFVYAAWIGHPESLTPPLTDALTRAKGWGTARLTEIADTEYAAHGETPERALRYLTHIMRYDLGPREEEALRLFGEKVRRYALV